MASCERCEWGQYCSDRALGTRTTSHKLFDASLTPSPLPSSTPSQLSLSPPILPVTRTIRANDPYAPRSATYPPFTKRCPVLTCRVVRGGGNG